MPDTETPAAALQVVFVTGEARRRHEDEIGALDIDDPGSQNASFRHDSVAA